MLEQTFILSFGEVVLWFLITAIVFTIYGIRVNTTHIIDLTIDSLIDQGFLKYRKNTDGEIEILKHNEADDKNPG